MTTGGAAEPSTGDAAPLFPDDYPPGVERVGGFWDLSRLLPFPRRALRCATCGDGDLVVKDWKFHARLRVGSQRPWRCDVRMKCMTCGYVPTFGVLVPQDMFERARLVFGAKHGTWIHWRVGREALGEVHRGS